ncbi:cyclodeaminase/cyclohydrolase family protein [Halomonas sp. HNIBRBA4712]|uniref:cyclodeaminase/cyclohydrolase family protein n=1 Tax=Halomonas sp. HNIBRBA4712 TaxID=3373087 RepID=UPI0037463D60
MNQKMPPTELWQTPLGDFRDALAHRPMPGCGAAAAVSADFGLALILKGLHLGQQHQRSAERAALITRGEALKRALAPLAGEDVAAFDAMMAALQKPQTSEEEKRLRAEAIQLAARRAVAVPLETARRCLEALTLGEETMAHIEAQFESDATAGAHLLTAAVQSVLLNVDANLEALGSDDERQRALKERDTLKIELAAARKSLGLVE